MGILLYSERLIRIYLKLVVKIGAYRSSVDVFYKFKHIQPLDEIAEILIIQLVEILLDQYISRERENKKPAMRCHL